MRVRALLVAALAMALTSCASVPIDTPSQKAADRTREGLPGPAALPTVVAVMPFANDAPEKSAGAQVRKAFYNRFSSEPYVDVELAAVDEQVARLERNAGTGVADLRPQQICDSIGCDGLVFGRVVDYQRVYAGVYSRLRAEAEVWMVNARTGREVVRVRDSVDYVEGNIPLSPLGLVMSAVTTAINVREIQVTRMVAELAEKLVAKMPVPAGAPAVKRPAIRELITNVREGPFGRGKVVRVGLEGEAGGIAGFDIGSFKRGLPMKETQLGIYLGEYAVLPGDNTRDMPIVAYLRRPSGPESQWIDAGGLVTIDTLVPDRVTDLRARGFRDRIEISWDYPRPTPDLAGFRVLRSRQPLSGYEQIASSEFNTYEDRSVRPDETYYYRVIAADTSGNESEVSSSASARLVTKGPSVLQGELTSDTVLSGIYFLKGQVLVPRGVVLTIGPDTTILAEKGAGIQVRGRLAVGGASGQVRVFSRRSEKWAGIVVAEGSVTMSGIVVSGAETGVTLRDANGVVENSSITDNGVGVSISGGGNIVVRNCWVAGNRTGIELVGPGSKVLQSVIVRNGTGLSLRDFTGEVSENIIADNEQNVSSDMPLQLDPNYIGERRESGAPRYARLP